MTRITASKARLLMPYNIELMSIGVDIYPLLERSADELNSIQNEFHFRLTSTAEREPALTYARSTYKTSEIWKFLKQQRIQFGGHRPFIIAFVSTPLRSNKYNDIFGSHQAAEGLAVVTMVDAGLYVKEDSRYCCYYLTRYCLSFVNPLIQVHDDPDRSSCYFHLKFQKAEIRHSMDSGEICDGCLAQLDGLNIGATAHQLGSGEREALKSMRAYVSGQLPYALVMKGGGVRGLAFAGALLELEKYVWFDRHVGTSAGAIAAALLSASYRPDELKELFLNKNFRDFLDAPIWKLPFNLIFKRGAYPGEAFESWIAGLLARKFSNTTDVLMSDLGDALVYAAQPGRGAIAFDSRGPRKDASAAFAVRCSMSLPWVFVPPLVDGIPVYDGGLRANFPLARFLAEYGKRPFMALFLEDSSTGRKRLSTFRDFLRIAVEGEDRELIRSYRQKIVVIDTAPIKTMNFNLSPIEKKFLLTTGKAAALRFLLDRKMDRGPTLSEVERAESECEALREEVKKIRQLRYATRVRWAVGIGVLMVSALVLFVAFFRKVIPSVSMLFAE
jgi:predicted acylesterase/phospholipase RssA